MVNFTKEQIFEFLKTLGLTEKDFLNDGENFDLFSFVGINPTVDKDDQRQLSPYEILRIPPQFKNGKELPIVYKINRRIKKLGNYKGNNLVFFNKNKKKKTQNELLEDLKEEYERALFFGDSERVESLLIAINEISSEVASKLRFSYFAYIKHYKKMKRQLLQDVFAHFFTIYMQNKKSSVKKGLLRKDKRFRPYVIDPDYSLYTGIKQDSITMFDENKVKPKIFDDEDLNLDEGVITDVTFQDENEEYPEEKNADDLLKFQINTDIVEQTVSNEAIRMNMENIEENEKVEQKINSQTLAEPILDLKNTEGLKNEENNEIVLNEDAENENNKEDETFFSVIKKAIHFNPIHPKEMDNPVEKSEETNKSQNGSEPANVGSNQEQSFSE